MNQLRFQIRRILPTTVAAALALFALVAPATDATAATTGAARTAQTAPVAQNVRPLTSMICAYQAVPSGYIVTAVSPTNACQGYLLYTISLPSNGARLCTVGAPIPAGYVIIAGTTAAQPQCDNQFETQTITQVYNGVVACFGGVLPSPYVITSIDQSTANSCSGPTMVLDQETPGITAGMNTIKWNDYVPTAVGTGSQCARYGTEVIYPAYSGIIACGAGTQPPGYVITRVWGSYGGCLQYEGLEYCLPYRVRNASWMSSRISQRMRSRRNQCSSAKAASTTQRCTPRPEP
jgi:hypothetical protein